MTIEFNLLEENSFTNPQKRHQERVENLETEYEQYQVQLREILPDGYPETDQRRKKVREST